MKKTLALLLAAAFAVPAFAGNIFSNVETYGEIDTIGFTQSYDAAEKAVANQVLFGLSMDLVEDVRSNVTFLYQNNWGGWTGDSVDDYLNDIEVAEANVVISNVFGALETKIGRQFYGNENDPILYVGPHHGQYALVRSSVYSLDGALVTWSNDTAALSAFYAQIYNGSDERLTGVTFDYAFTNNLTAGLYWYDYSDADHYGVWGLKAAYQNETAKIGAYYAKNYDNGVFSHNNIGWMLKADAAINVDMEKVALTPRLSYYHTEKDYYVDDANYTAGIMLANRYGFLSSSGDDWRVFNAGIDLGVKAWEKVTFSFDYLNGQQNRTWIGNEFDLVAKYQHNDYVAFTLGGALVTNTDVEDIYGGQLGLFNQILIK